MNRFQFVADHQRRYGVKRPCTLLGIARSSFYYWRRTAAVRAARQAADAQLAARIRTVHRASDGTYGVPRITAELRENGEVVNHKRVTQSIGAIGSSADNALAESFNATCKREILQGHRAWDTEREVHLDLFRWLHRYNTVRRHSRLGHRSPIAYERALRTTPTTLAKAA